MLFSSLYIKDLYDGPPRPSIVDRSLEKDFGASKPGIPDRNPNKRRLSTASEGRRTRNHKTDCPIVTKIWEKIYSPWQAEIGIRIRNVYRHFISLKRTYSARAPSIEKSPSRMGPLFPGSVGAVSLNARRRPFSFSHEPTGGRTCKNR